MTHSQTVRDLIRGFVVENYLFGAGDVGYDTSLLEEGIIDSTGVLGLVMFVEETFDIAVADDEVVPENFDSIEGLVSYVAAKRGTSSREAVG